MLALLQLNFELLMRCVQIEYLLRQSDYFSIGELLFPMESAEFRSQAGASLEIHFILGLTSLQFQPQAFDFALVEPVAALDVLVLELKIIEVVAELIEMLFQTLQLLLLTGLAFLQLFSSRLVSCKLFPYLRQLHFSLLSEFPLHRADQVVLFADLQFQPSVLGLQAALQSGHVFREAEAFPFCLLEMIGEFVFLFLEGLEHFFLLGPEALNFVVFLLDFVESVLEFLLKLLLSFRDVVVEFLQQPARLLILLLVKFYSFRQLVLRLLDRVLQLMDLLYQHPLVLFELLDEQLGVAGHPVGLHLLVHHQQLLIIVGDLGSLHLLLVHESHELVVFFEQLLDVRFFAGRDFVAGDVGVGGQEVHKGILLGQPHKFFDAQLGAPELIILHKYYIPLVDHPPTAPPSFSATAILSTSDFVSSDVSADVQLLASTPHHFPFSLLSSPFLTPGRRFKPRKLTLRTILLILLRIIELDALVLHDLAIRSFHLPFGFSTHLIFQLWRISELTAQVEADYDGQQAGQQAHAADEQKRFNIVNQWGKIMGWFAALAQSGETLPEFDAVTQNSH